MKITFVLPGSSRVPVGGYKVVFEYANHLTLRGHSVTVIHPAHLDESAPLQEKIYDNARYLLWGATQSFGPERWFKLNDSVKLKWVRTLGESNIPDADAVVATGWPTAEYIATYSPAKGRKFYLVQSYETWWGPEPRVRATWKLPLHKIVIARWLDEIATQMKESATYIPNGLDFQAFGCDLPVAQRTNPRVLMLYHSSEVKGSPDGLSALTIARKQIPDLKATFYGVYSKPKNLPSWITYERNPPQTKLRELYNAATVFLAPSWSEGWPLPPAEAMMCGAALVCTDIGGHREYAIQDRNALLAKARNPDALASALIRILTDGTLRKGLAANALIDISRFTWTAATDRFEETLSGFDNRT